MSSNIDKAKCRNGFLSLGNIRDILLILLMIIVSWKILNSTFSVQGVDFSDLLSMLLAFFAILLSAAFYFKATETSNKFYDNIYKFTKDVSEILGRIESGFGEQLRHIDDGYTGLRDKIDRIPFDINSARKLVEHEQTELEKFENENKLIIEDLAKKANLGDDEKNNIIKRLSENDKSLSDTRSELAELKSKIYLSEIAKETGVSDIEYIYNNLGLSSYGRKYKVYHPTLINEIFNNEKANLHPFVMGGMLQDGLLDDSDNLTKKGVDFISKLLSIQNIIG